MAAEKDQLTQIEEKLRSKVDTEFKEAVEQFRNSLIEDGHFGGGVSLLRESFRAAFSPTESMMQCYDYDPATAILRILILDHVGPTKMVVGNDCGKMLVKKAQWWSEEVRGKATQRKISEILDGDFHSLDKVRDERPDTHVTIVGKGITVSSVETGEITDEHRQRLEEGGISKEEICGSA
jgi:hypothetical protein